MDRDQEHISSSLPNNINNSIAHDPLPPSLPSTSSLHSTTYIVQVPKDQVYRVPPPENALIAERCRTNPNKSRKPLSSLCKFFVVLAIFIAAVIIIILVFYLALTAKDPTFRVEHIVTKSIRKTSPNPSHGHIPGDMFHVYVSLRSKNPNHHMSINYDEGREGWLTFRKRKIAKGESKTLHQASNDSAVLVIDFISVAGATLPGETNKKIRDDKQVSRLDVSLSLSLSMKISVKIKSSFLKTWARDLTILCDIRLNSLIKNTRIMSQSCWSDSQ